MITKFLLSYTRFS